LFDLAGIAGVRRVQILIGPVQLAAVQVRAAGQNSGSCEGVLRKTRADQARITSANMARLAEMAVEAGLLLYLEALVRPPVEPPVRPASADRAGEPAQPEDSGRFLAPLRLG